MRITLDNLQGPEIIALLQEHLAEMRGVSPPESVHALDLSGEIKSMRTARHHKRKGVAAHMLRHILDEAARRQYGRLSLETGSQPHFEPARALYASFGFQRCGPFGDYVADPNSVFMTRVLE